MENNYMNELLFTSLKIQRGIVVSVNSVGEILVASNGKELTYTCEFLQTNNAALPEFNPGDSVLFAIDPESEGNGYIFGILHRYFNSTKEKTEEIFVDTVEQKEIKLNIEEKFEIRCGKSSLIMNKDGKIIIKGTNITTRARGENKIKGAAVTIN